MSWNCGKCGELNDEIHTACWKCKVPRFGEIGAEATFTISLSTSDTVPGRKIAESKGIVFGEAILGANVFRDVLAGVRDIVGGRSGAYENKLKDGRDTAIRELIEEATELKADAIVAIRVDYEYFPPLAARFSTETS